MSGLWVQIAQFFVALSLLIVLHEGGHFFFARLFKTRVEKFYLFFDFLFPFSNIMPFSLWKKKKGDTEYGIGWFPLGGYVKIAGMVDESMDKEQLAAPPQPWEFRSKKAWQRLLIMLGGIIVNVITAYLIYVMILMVWGQRKTPVSMVSNGIEITDSLGYQLGFKDGDKIISVDGTTMYNFEETRKEVLLGSTVVIDRQGQQMTIQLPVDVIDKIARLPKGTFVFDMRGNTVIDSVVANSPAMKAGLHHGDVLVGINGIANTTFFNLAAELRKNKGQQVQLLVNRNGHIDTVPSMVSNEGTLGFMRMAPDPENNSYKQVYGFDPVIKKYSFPEAIPAAFTLSVQQVKDYARQLGKIFNFKSKAYKHVGGFDAMRNIFPKVWNWQAFWSITAFISIALAFMNLLPIPGLDGGYVMFTLWEMITKRKPNEKFMEVVTTVGLVLLLILMVAANANDIMKYFK